MSRRAFVTTVGAAGLGGALAAGTDARAWAADRVFDGQDVLPDRAVIVAGGEVVQVLPRDRVPPGVAVTHEPGTTILPGLIDAHVHCMAWQDPLFLAYGVTMVRDVGNDLQWILACRERARTALSPTILCAGPLIDGPTPLHPIVARACVDAADAVTAVRETAEAGVDAIKLYVRLPAEWLPALVAEAHAHGLKTSMHCQGTGVLAAAEAGVEEFHHLDGLLADLWPGQPGWLEAWGDPGMAATLDAQRRVADRIAACGMAATPTLAYWNSQWRLRAADFSAENETPGVPSEMHAWQGEATDAALSERWRRALEAAQGFVRLLLEREVSVLAGSDAPCGAQTPGLSLWRELSLLAEAGMPPLHALRAATSGLGSLLNRPGLGRLQPGSAADLVVVRGDLTAAIPQQPDITAVVRGGVAHQPSHLLAEARKVASRVTEDPWSAQFRAHRPKAGDAQ